MDTTTRTLIENGYPTAYEEMRYEQEKACGTIRERLKETFADDVRQRIDNKLRTWKSHPSKTDSTKLKRDILTDLFGSNKWGEPDGVFDNVIRECADIVSATNVIVENVQEREKELVEKEKRVKALLGLKDEKTIEAIKFGKELEKLFKDMDEPLMKSVSCDIYAYLCGNNYVKDLEKFQQKGEGNKNV